MEILKTFPRVFCFPKSRINEKGGKLGCLPFVRINQSGWALNNGKSFSKISKPTERNGAYHLHFDFPYCFRLMRDWKLESLANGKEISAVPFRTEKEEYLWKYSTISEWNFRKITLPFDFKPKFSRQMVSTPDLNAYNLKGFMVTQCS